MKDEPEPIENRLPNEVVGRVSPSYWWFIFFWMGLGFMLGCMPLFLAPVANPMTANITVLSLAAVLCWIPGLLMGWWVLRMRVVADENGLSWRSMAGWERVNWQQVQDFYIKPLPQSKRSFVVETEVGKLTLDNVNKRVPLQKVIERRARWAKSKTWDERIQQELELSGEEVFESDLSFARQFRWMMALMCCVVPSLIVVKIIENWPLNFPAMWAACQVMGWPIVVGMVLLTLVVSALYPLMMLAHYPRAKAIRERAGQRISVSPKGIEWRSGADSIRADWNDVTDFYLAPIPGWVEVTGRFVVETKRGTFDWITGNVKNGNRLSGIVAKYACGGTSGRWRVKREESQQSVANANVYTYRSREARAMIWLFTFLAAMSWLGLAVNVSGANPRANTPADIAFGWAMSSGLSVLCGFAWLYYFRFAIRISDTQISARTLLKVVSIAWTEVREYESSEGFCRVCGANQMIRFYGLIERVDELRGEIQKRAINSLNRQW
jgi:uncharacterized membrane protein (DUF485 family)